MGSTIYLVGQWIGFFAYGPEYGNALEGERVKFRMFLVDKKNGEFEGTCADLEGIGSQFQISKISGFTDDSMISFTKEYPKYRDIDEAGNSYPSEHTQQPRLSYEGLYNETLKSFSGQWEMISNERLFHDGSQVDFGTGTWEMIKDD